MRPPASQLVGLTLALLGATGPVLASCSKALSVMPEHWPPYSFVKDAQRPHGLDIELIDAIFKEAGCELIIGPALPVARRLAMFEQGQSDVMMAASETLERRKIAYFSSAYRHESVGLYALAKNKGDYQDIQSLDSVVERKLAVLAPKVGWYGKDYARNQDKLRASGTLSEFTSFSQGLRMLKAYRGALLLGDDAAIQYEAAQQAMQVVRLSFTVLRAPVHLMLSKASTTTQDVAALDAAIGRLERSGALKAIRAKYGAQ